MQKFKTYIIQKFLKFSFFTKMDISEHLTQYKLFGLPLLSLEFSENPVKYRLFFLTFPFLSVQSSAIIIKYHFLFLKWQKLRLSAQSLTKQFCKNLTFPLILWWDHSLGGGTEYYFLNQKKQLLKHSNILRIQYLDTDACYQITLFQYHQKYTTLCFSLKELEQFLDAIPFQLIVVNNLVSYPTVTKILQIIHQLKARQNCLVSFRLHDFYAVCPFSHNLMCEGHFCQGPAQSVCQQCPYVKQNPDAWGMWRKSWESFLDKTTDEILGFSQNSKNLLIQAYSKINHKIKVIPHQVNSLQRIGVPKHSGFHISILGTIINEAKGLKIINDLETLIANDKNIYLTIIGMYIPLTLKTQVSWKYQPNELPFLFKKYNTDIILIPSICPETFSYTTTEAIYSGLPVACFNFGAQAEKIKTYSKGLIISNPDAQTALKEILTFSTSS